MVLTLKKGASKEDIEQLDDILYKKESSVGFNAKKYAGRWKGRLSEDPLIIQKKLRDEWERDLS